jgi:hypothetical protein
MAERGATTHKRPASQLRPLFRPLLKLFEAKLRIAAATIVPSTVVGTPLSLFL